MGGAHDKARPEEKAGGVVVRKEIPSDIASAAGLRPEDAAVVRDLCETYRRRLRRNYLRRGYYLMHQRPKELGIAVPPRLRNLEQVVGWPAKAVDSLANRSQFDGFVSADEKATGDLARIASENSLKRLYRQAVKSELQCCCSFLTVTAGEEGEPDVIVSAHPATAAAAIWDEHMRRIKAGMVVVDRDARPRHGDEPTWVDVFISDAVIRIKRDGAARSWKAEYVWHSMGRPLMVPMAHEATLERPFGKSRISRAVMNITDDAMRASVRSEISAEFFTSPQKYLLGAEADALEGMSKWDAYIGNIFAVSKDAEGDIPSFGQLAQGSMQPHIDYMRSLAARFSGETNVPLSELGVVTDNPSSAEAIYAAKEALVIDAQNLNADNGDALRDVALMALAVVRGTDYATVAGEGLAVQAKFRNPAMPSVVSQSDAMVKMISVLPWMAESDVALEELGFSDDQIQRLRSDRAKATSRALVASATQGTGLALPTSNPDAAARQLADEMAR